MGYFSKALCSRPVAIEGELETAIYKAGGIRESNFGDLHKIGWARSSRTDKGVIYIENNSCSCPFKLVLHYILCFSLQPFRPFNCHTFQVHSLATMISLKMEIPEFAWDNDPNGFALADYVNSYLPQNIRVFSILPSQR